MKLKYLVMGILASALINGLPSVVAASTFDDVGAKGQSSSNSIAHAMLRMGSDIGATGV